MCYTTVHWKWLETSHALSANTGVTKVEVVVINLRFRKRELRVQSLPLNQMFWPRFIVHSAFPQVNIGKVLHTGWAGWHTRYSDWLRAERSGDRIPVRARFSASVQTGPGAHPASCTMGTGSFPWVKSGRVVTLTPRPLLVPRSWKSRAISLLPLWTVKPLQSLSACTRVTFLPHIGKGLLLTTQFQIY